MFIFIFYFSVCPPSLSARSPPLSISVPPPPSRFDSVGACSSLLLRGYVCSVKCEGDVVHEGIAGCPKMRVQPHHCIDAARGRHRVFVLRYIGRPRCEANAQGAVQLANVSPGIPSATLNRTMLAGKPRDRRDRWGTLIPAFLFNLQTLHARTFGTPASNLCPRCSPFEPTCACQSMSLWIDLLCTIAPALGLQAPYATRF